MTSASTCVTLSLMNATASFDRPVRTFNPRPGRRARATSGGRLGSPRLDARKLRLNFRTAIGRLSAGTS